MNQTTTTTITFNWKPGNKPGIAFANLSQLQRYEPETYALFKHPVFDGQRIETATYNYKIRITKYGPSVTRFLNNNNSYQDSVTPESEVTEKETKGSLELLNDTLSHKTKLILELKTTVNKMNAMLQQLEAQVSKQ
jgi:hypothetical protein